MITGWQPPPRFEAGAHTLAAWLNAASDPNATVNPGLCLAIYDASKGLSDERTSERERLLGDIALRRTPAATAWAALDALTWADGAIYHAWRLADSLQTALAHDRSHVVESNQAEMPVTRPGAGQSWSSDTGSVKLPLFLSLYFSSGKQHIEIRRSCSHTSRGRGPRIRVDLRRL